MILKDSELILDTLLQGGIIAYPTEGVLGLGCDPDNEEAVKKLLSLKNRPMHKGLILVAKSYSQLLPYVDDSRIPMDMRTEIFSSWPAAITWLLPAANNAPKWITGDSDFIAVRVSKHIVVGQLCELFNKPLVSTSANVAGAQPALNADQLKLQFSEPPILVEGELGGNKTPSQIRHGMTGKIIRDK
ncbi:Sua5/YciO/YrdC/YwlC family protein [Paraglaciecola sp. 2405UD69-4]|uniref:Sua5/YciO/YrdC/YwlC family protein n=1 Tax=Paraglaciecola sp. 2405UD69-4 TaxID=3391836 RepID=UPI0039C9C4EC